MRYRVGTVEDLLVGECTMHRAVTASGERYWHMWFRVNRETDGLAFDFVVPMNVNGSFTENGVGGKTWGLLRNGELWQVLPSINVVNTGELHPGEHALPSLWHQTPAIEGVPADEPWIAGPP